MPADERLAELLLEWEEGRDQGREITAAELCRDCPELASQLERRIRALDAMAWLEGDPLQTADESTHGQGPRDDTNAPADGRASQRRALGDYEILEEIGRGGMGVVFKARQVNLGRTVALKVIRAGELAGRERIARFQAEARAAAKLDHPGIVAVYEVGQFGAEHFYSMALVAGGSLDETVKNAGPLAPREAAQLLKSVAEAVQFAHEKGIVHRDIKPQNILLDGSRGPRIADFGLAKQIAVDAGHALQSDVSAERLTQAGQIIGTPSYMSPEQATGNSGEIGAASDIYSLGATLYWLLTGRPPFQTASAIETIRQVVEAEPAAQRRLNLAIPRDLETICLKCLRKAPAARYSTAGALAADLGRWLEGKPIVARRATPAGRAWLWCKRRPAVASLSLALVTTFVAGTLVAVEKQNALRAEGYVDSLISADIGQVPQIVEELERYRVWADALLAERDASAATDSAEKLRTSLALLPVDGAKMAYLCNQLLRVSPAEFVVARDALLPYKARMLAARLVEPLWEAAADAKREARDRFQAACALAAFAHDDERWRPIAPFVAGRLVTLETSELVAWRAALRPARTQLIAALGAIYRDAAAREQSRIYATETVADYAADSPETLFDLLADAEPFQFATIYARLTAHQGRAIEMSAAELVKKPLESASEDEKERLGKRQANAAMALCKLGATDRVWPLFGNHADARARSYFIHWLGPLGSDPRPILERLDQEPDAAIRQALVLVLGEFSEAQLAAAERGPLIERLLGIYEKNPDRGLHAAAEWLLRKWGQSGRIAEIVHKLRENEEQLRARAVDDPREWYVNTQGQTFVILEPGEFLMGSPETEPGHNPNETQFRGTIAHAIVIAAHEVTLADWRRFQQERPEIAAVVDTSEYVKTDDSAQVGMDWYESAAYCNWLSEKQGIPPEEWCYVANAEGNYSAGMAARPNGAGLPGYRLPTESEWEYACRAGTTTAAYCGGSQALLPHYARYGSNGEGRTWPVGSVKPNDWGLFDMLGNVLEWCHNSSTAYPTARGGRILDWFDTKAVGEADRRAMRGGAYRTSGFDLRCAARYDDMPALRNPSIGFRPARTWAVGGARPEPNSIGGLGLDWADEIDCAKGPKVFSIGPTFDSATSWSLTLEFWATEFANAFLFFWGDERRACDPIHVELAGAELIAAVDDSRSGERHEIGCQLSDADLGRWNQLRIEYDAKGPALALYLGGKLIRNDACEVVPWPDRPMPLYLGGREPTYGSMRFVGRLRNVRLANR